MSYCEDIVYIISSLTKKYYKLIITKMTRKFPEYDKDGKDMTIDHTTCSPTHTQVHWNRLHYTS